MTLSSLKSLLSEDPGGIVCSLSFYAGTYRVRLRDSRGRTWSGDHEKLETAIALALERRDIIMKGTLNV